jgi:hypothetical protein
LKLGLAVPSTENTGDEEKKVENFNTQLKTVIRDEDRATLFITEIKKLKKKRA